VAAPTASAPAARAPDKQGVCASAIAEYQTVRVVAARLDELITRIGEPIIAGAGAQLVARRAGDDLAVVRQVLVGVLGEESDIEVINAVADPLFAMERMTSSGRTFSCSTSTFHGRCDAAAGAR
jgi:hypothetical protein